MKLKDTGLTAQDIKDKVNKYMIETYERFDFIFMMRIRHHILTFTQVLQLIMQEAVMKRLLPQLRIRLRT